jgi:glycosylphosphatidylinositol transamidase (GPIT) subunit GPI8
LRSHLVEKLDCEKTSILPLEFHHSRELVAKKREEISNYAIHKVKNNAKTTAKQMSVRLGALRTISDVELTETFMNTGGAGDSNELSQVLQKKSKTKIISAVVKATFTILTSA